MGAVVLGRLTEVPRARLAGWAGLVGFLAVLSYAANLLTDDDPPDDLLYRWSTAVGGLVEYTIILVIVLALCRGLSPGTLGLRRPESWRRAVGATLAALAAIWVIGAVLNIFLEAGEEQGLVPSDWESGRAAPFAANFVVVALVAPTIEELTYRGLGFAAVRDAFDAFGVGAAIAVTALAFGLAHGLVIGLPVLTIFGAILAWLRLKTGSLYPCIALHALFNGAALIAAVSV
jgi:membrane protease YdiL (CAAX protease family)